MMVTSFMNGPLEKWSKNFFQKRFQLLTSYFPKGFIWKQNAFHAMPTIFNPLTCQYQTKLNVRNKATLKPINSFLYKKVLLYSSLRESLCNENSNLLLIFSTYHRRSLSRLQTPSVLDFWKIKLEKSSLTVYSELNFYCLCSLQKSILKLILAG